MLSFTDIEWYVLIMALFALSLVLVSLQERGEEALT